MDSDPTYTLKCDEPGLARRTLIELEQGRTIGSLKTWHALAHALSAPLSQLVNTLGEGHTPPAPPRA